MFNSLYQNFVNVHREGNCKCSVLIRSTEFALSALYSTDIIIIIINLKVDIGVILCKVKKKFQIMFCRSLFRLDSSSYDGLREWQVLSCKLISRTSNVTKPLFKRF